MQLKEAGKFSDKGATALTSSNTITLANVTPVATSITIEIPIAILLVVDLLGLLLSMPLCLLPVYIV